ncbi:orotate phosphoribosyltransferase [Faecalicatena sp. AGMB00832]|uniref:Orotate phosphoribosyltransferase n=1 Tax=Faecalicatena faecalis TaxID=2726362 RepID=A0ABS6D2A3_9FIRM|nr:MULTISPECIES: orotate phosphoribosyltransferase [Faecalicatena]MBU3875724.1 orotate phosphoribosyltransferase [Faecalicatena faecalis]MCI6466874.1 orotate phosphoribosyltransferase [Faecalicatena sp.]MDY5617582.1 orotate phosphoribosyltransferase [Lachnospiraceae bacterium]
MDERLVNLRSTKNPKARIKIMSGHFATRHSHVNTYIDMSTVKTRHNNARETAKTLAAEYLMNTMVDTIVCLKNTEVIGTFMAEELADSTNASMSGGNNISVVTPEFDSSGQILFRDNNQRMIEGKQVLILIDSMATGALAYQAIESVLYYGGTVCGICAVFSAISKVAGMEVKTIFASSDLPDYHVYAPNECPMCKAGQRIEGLINSFGYAKL